MEVKCHEFLPRPVARMGGLLPAPGYAGRGWVGTKLIGDGAFGDSGEKRDESVRYVFGLGSVDAMVVRFEKIE